MKSLLKWLILVPIALVLLVLATLNRQNVAVALDPIGTGLPGLKFEAPLFVVMLVCGALGVVVGSLATWLGQGKHRRNARAARGEAARLLNENERLRWQATSRQPGLAAPARSAA